MKLDIRPKDSSHHLLTSKDSAYFTEFNSIGNQIISNGVMSARKIKKQFLTNSAIISSEQNNQIIMACVEFAVTTSLYLKFPLNFEFEKKVNSNNNTDVECQFHVNNHVFNLEVKCSVKKENTSNDNFVISSEGFFDHYFELVSELGKFLPGLTPQKRYDNSFFSNLKSAQNKFPEHSTNSCNILFVGCDDADDIDRHYSYLYSQGGVFGESPRLSPKEFDKVDVIILSNMQYLHTKKKDSYSWNIKNALLLDFWNPYSVWKKIHYKYLLREKLNLLGNEFENYKGVGFMKVKHFIFKEMGEKKNQYFF